VPVSARVLLKPLPANLSYNRTITASLRRSVLTCHRRCAPKPFDSSGTLLAPFALSDGAGSGGEVSLDRTALAARGVP
jgi:hypothetical protein